MDPASLDVAPLARLAVTVVHGTADRLSPFRAAEDLKQRVPSARLVAVPEGSHMLPNTHPALIRDELVDLVRRTGDACQPAS